MLRGKKIILGICGSIAAYKTAFLVRLLVQAGAEVKVIMTAEATKFITPLTLSTLSKNEALVNIASDSNWENHALIGRWADVMIIAPLSCNTLSKMSTGLCDNLLMAVYLSATCPVFVAPAMDEDMWLHPSTKNNLANLASFGNVIIPVGVGELASGLSGPGRMAEPEEIVLMLVTHFKVKDDFKGKNVLVTAGPTYEAIDPVRFIGNHSSGKMGIAIAREFYARGANVHLVIGPVGEPLPEGMHITAVTSASEMFEACKNVFPLMDIAVMSAAVADYKALDVAPNKIKKNDEDFTLVLKKTVDILKHLGSVKTEKQILVGFALETNNEVDNAKQKLVKKNADLIVLNSLNDAGAGFKHDSNKITIFDKKGGEIAFETKNKKAVAIDIVNTILKYSNA